MKPLFLLIFLSFNTVIGQINYNDYFTQETLRLNFIFLTNNQNTHIALHSFQKEEKWVGSKKNLIYPDYGNYKITLTDVKTEKTIFSKGFSNLAYEWQQSHISQGKLKSFEQVIHTPMPKYKSLVTIYLRQKEQWIELHQELINPSDILLIQETPTSYPVEKILVAAEPQNAIDLVIIPDGYTAEQMDIFTSDAKKMTEYLLQNNAFFPYKNKFNVTVVKVPSAECGADNQTEYSFRNTAFNSHFYTFYTERYLTTPSLFAVADAAAIAGGYDQLLILVNTPRHGGGAFYNTVNVVAAKSNSGLNTFVHEFGHGLAGLADEYFYNDHTEAFSENFYPLDQEPWEENITTLKNFKTKWANLIPKNTPIPTPRTYNYWGEVGVFEGAGYSSKGIYSPSMLCIMGTTETNEFCPVCKQSIAKTIRFLTQ